MNTAPSKTRLILTLALAAVAAALIVPSSALAVSVVPKSGGSPNADAISDLFKFLLVIGVIVFLGVEAILIRSLAKHRKSTGAVAQNRGEGGSSELGWTIASASLVVVILALTFIKLPDITNPPNGTAPGVIAMSSLQASLAAVPNPPNGKKLTINVSGRQYIWRYTYGDTVASPYAYTEMVVPSDTVIVLKIQSTDVIHSWWIPALGGKFDAVPGSTNYTWFKAPTPKNPTGDVYTGQCAELCGRQHANMVASVRVITPAAFKVWIAKQKDSIAAANQAGIADRQKLINEGQIPNLTPPAN